jgi:iron complex outermembrane receptor protein
LGSTSVDLGRGANLLIAGSLYGARGQDFYFPEYDSPETNRGRAIDADADSAYHTFASLVYGSWTFTASFNAREKWDPTAPYDAIFSARSASDRDARSFVELGFLKETGKTTWRWRVYYDRYRYDGQWDILLGDVIEKNRELDIGSVAGSQLIWRRELGERWGAVSLGAEATGALRASQRNFDTAPEPVTYLDINEPDRGGAVFVQHELPLRRTLTLQWGVRADDSVNNQRFFSPRTALIYRRSKNTTWKLIYGKAFRNPNLYERFYDDVNSQIANLALKPENADTVEAVMERRLTGSLTLIASAYRYRLRNLIAAQPATETVVQFRNGGGVHASGVEAELGGRLWRSLEAQSSIAVQRATDAATAAPLPDSPGLLYKARVGAPLGGRLFAAVGMQSTSERRTRGGLAVAPYSRMDATLSTVRLHRNFDLIFGVRNALDVRYYDPVGYGRRMESILQDGRSLFVKILWRTEE